MTAVLEVDRLSVRYGGVRALHEVALSVPEAAIMAVLGANGAGKTTLLRALSGLVACDGGSARYRGQELTGRPPEEIVRRGVAHVPEGRGVIAELTVGENVRLGHWWRRDRADARAAEAEAYALFPTLHERRNMAASTLSGGERQMLVLARALVSRPSLLLLDEPSLGLAPRITASIMALLRDLVARTGITVLLVEQNARSALSVADRAIVLNLGQVAVTEDAATLARDDALRHHYLGF
ncbi:MAG: ABC transporter ATP-binding protein [Mycobacteriales bacterium]